MLAGVVLVTAAAAAVRLHRLGHWSLFANEPFTLRDSLSGAFVDGKPLLFQINHHLVQPWLPLDEFGLRLVPFLAGVVSIPVIYLCGRELLDRRAGLFAALLTAANPWHLYWSQNARFYSLVFLFSALLVTALYLAFARRSSAWLVAGIVFAAAGVLSHASVGLVVAGVCIWLFGWLGARFYRGKAPSRLQLVGAGTLGLAFGTAVIGHLWPMLRTWVSLQPGWGASAPDLVLSYGNWITAGVVAMGFAGAYTLWREGRRELVLYLVACVAVPFTALLSLSILVAVSVGYLYATAPVLLLLAGGFLAWLTRLEGLRRADRTAIVGTLLLVALATGAPTFVSHLIDGTRPDFRSAALFFDRHAGESDLLLVDESAPYRYYLPDREVDGFVRDTVALGRALSRASEREGDLWIAAYQRERGGFDDLGLGGAAGWIRDACRREARFGEPRLDHRSDVVEVYRCGANEDRGP